MDVNIWEKRWLNNDIGFHEAEPNPNLINYLTNLNLTTGSRIFVPLCGKTADIRWLLSNGFRVAGIELVELAVDQLFSDNGMKPAVTSIGKLKRFSDRNIDIFVGDVFDLTNETLGAVDGVYDRGALVAIPPDKRASYAAHLTQITRHAPQLVITCDYDHRKIKGSPFPVSGDEMQDCYGKAYQMALAERAEIPGGLKGISPAHSDVWVLRENCHDDVRPQSEIALTRPFDSTDSGF